MAKRNGLPLDLIWVLVDLTNARSADLLTAAATKVGQIIPGATLSVNRNIAGTQALVKVTDTDASFRASLAGPVRAAIIRTFTEVDHVEALAMVTTVEWAGPPQAP
jgi:hypothetical protein